MGLLGKKELCFWVETVSFLLKIVVLVQDFYNKKFHNKDPKEEWNTLDDSWRTLFWKHEVNGDIQEIKMQPW